MAGRNESPQDIKNKKILAKNLKELSFKKKVKQVDVSKSTGISLSTLNGYYNAQRLPSPGNVEKLADFFNVSKSTLDPRFKDIGIDSETIYGDVKPKSLDEMAEEYSKQFRSYGDKPISEEQRKAIKEITLAYLKSQGINDSSEDQ